MTRRGFDNRKEKLGPIGHGTVEDGIILMDDPGPYSLRRHYPVQVSEYDLSPALRRSTSNGHCGSARIMGLQAAHGTVPHEVEYTVPRKFPGEKVLKIEHRSHRRHVGSARNNLKHSGTLIEYDHE